jgi:hypothetical protein
MDSIDNQSFYFKPGDHNPCWQLDNPTAAHTGPIFGGRAISAMGRRPRDHMDRDLLLASLLRDRRLRMFRKQCLTLPAWAPAVAEHIPAHFQNRAQALIMLGCSHQLLIEKMRANIDLAGDPDRAEQMLKAMEACPPRGALFSRTDLDTAHPCGYARLCPWCHARSVQRLYGRLLAGPCMPERLAGKHLIVLKTRADGGAELDAPQVRGVRNDYRYRLRCVAHKLGIEGGVILHQVTPWIPRYNRPEQKRKIFAHEFAMVGVADISGIENIGRTTRELCDDWMIGEHELMLLPGSLPEALRYSLHGTAYKFDSSEIGLLVRDPKTVLYGIQGAAALQPMFLFDGQQAWSYVEAMKGTRLYDTFGNWRESQAEQKSCSPKPRVQSECGEECRKWAFESENDRKHRDAERRRRQLAAVALPYYRKFRDAGGKHLGRPALCKMLSEAGHVVSDWDARWLVKNLPAMDKPAAFEKSVARRTQGIAHCRQERLERLAVTSNEAKFDTKGLPAMIGTPYSASLQLCAQDQNVADVSDGEHVDRLRETERLADSDSIE